MKYFYIAILASIAVVGGSCTSGTSRADDSAASATSVEYKIEKVESLIHNGDRAVNSVDGPGQEYIQGYELLAKAREQAAAQGVAMPATADSLEHELRSRLRGARRALGMQVQILDGMESAQAPLKARIAVIDSLLR